MALDIAAMADNEVRAHERLQEPAVAAECAHLAKLLGEFTLGGGAAAGQRWLAFHAVGGVAGAGAGTAGAYARRAASATAQGAAVGEADFTDMFNKAAPLRRRKVFMLKVRQRAGSAVAAPTHADAC